MMAMLRAQLRVPVVPSTVNAAAIHLNRLSFQLNHSRSFSSPRASSTNTSSITKAVPHQSSTEKDLDDFIIHAVRKHALLPQQKRQFVGKKRLTALVCADVSKPWLWSSQHIKTRLWKLFSAGDLSRNCGKGKILDYFQDRFGISSTKQDPATGTTKPAIVQGHPQDKMTMTPTPILVARKKKADEKVVKYITTNKPAASILASMERPRDKTTVETPTGSPKAAQPPPKDTRVSEPVLLAGVLYPDDTKVSYPIQHRVLPAIQARLESSCYSFAQRHFLDELVRKRQRTCAQSAELHVWVRELLCQDRGKVHPVLPREAETVFHNLVSLRHIAVHRDMVSGRRLLELMGFAETAAVALNDPETAEWIRVRAVKIQARLEAQLKGTQELVRQRDRAVAELRAEIQKGIEKKKSRAAEEIKMEEEKAMRNLLADIIRLDDNEGKDDGARDGGDKHNKAKDGGYKKNGIMDDGTKNDGAKDNEATEDGKNGHLRESEEYNNSRGQQAEDKVGLALIPGIEKAREKEKERSATDSKEYPDSGASSLCQRLITSMADWIVLQDRGIRK